MRPLAVFAVAASMALAAAGASGRPFLQSAVAASAYDGIDEPPYDEEFDSVEDYTEQAGVQLFVGATACLFGCVAIPPRGDEAEAAALTRYGRNEVDVYAQSDPDTGTFVEGDTANALSEWRDALTFETTGAPVSGTVRATFAVEAAWNDSGAFDFYAYLYDPESEVDCGSDSPLPACYAESDAVRVSSLFLPFGGLPLPAPATGPDNFFALPVQHPDLGLANGAVDVTVAVELPLFFGRAMHFGAVLIAAADQPDDSAEVQQARATIVSLEVPPGVTVASAADALEDYHVVVPEPGAAAGVAAALAALAALRRR